MPEKIKKYTDKSRLFIKGKFTDDGAGWLLLQQLIIAPMSLLTTVLLAKVLSISDYGYYKYVLSVYSIVAIFGFIGFYNVSSLNVQRGEDAFFNLGFKYRKIFRWIPAIISVLISSYYFYQGNNFLGILFLITISSHLFVDLYDFYKVGVMGKGRFKLGAKLEVINYFVSFFPPIVVAYFTQSLYFVFGTMFFFQFLFRFIAFKYVKNTLGLQDFSLESIIGEKQTEYKKQAISLSFNTALSTAGVSGNSVIVFNRLGAEGNAIYSLALTFADFIGGIISSTLSKFIFTLSQMTKNGLSDQNKKRYTFQSFKKYFLFAILATIFCFIALPFVYEYLFPKYLFSYKYAVIYSISILAIALNPFLIYFTEKRMFKLINTVQIIVLILNFALLFFAATYFGVVGAIVVAIVTKFLNNGVFRFLMYRN